MNEIQKYWRDRVNNLLQWGAAIFILLVGWGVTRHETFAFGGNRNQRLASYSLLAASIVYTPLLPLAIRYIYRRFLNDGIDETVLSYRFAMTCAIILSALTLIVAVLISM